MLCPSRIRGSSCGMAPLPERRRKRRWRILATSNRSPSESSISGLTEEQVASLVESEVEPVHDLRLRLHAEVHQRVAAYQQIEPGYRGVPRDVVPGEDHPAAQVGAEQDRVVAGAEVPLAQRGRHRFERL